MKQEKANGTTLDDLANMVARGFEGVDKRFEDMGKRMVIKEEFNTRIGSLDKKVDKLEENYQRATDLQVEANSYLKDVKDSTKKSAGYAKQALDKEDKPARNQADWFDAFVGYQTAIKVSVGK